MSGYRNDTVRHGRRNRFRPALRHETTGRGANSGGRWAGRRDGTIERMIVHDTRETGMGDRERSSGRSCVIQWQADMARRRTINRMIVRLVRSGSRGGKKDEPRKLIYTM